MQFLVTGASGFIGRRLTRRLLSEGHTVHALTRDAGRAAGHLPAHPALHVHGWDWLRPDTRADVVIHLAANLRYQGDRQDLYRDNVSLTLNLYDWARRTGASRFLFASSLEAGGPSSVPRTEDLPARPVSRYGWSKLQAERELDLRAHPSTPVVSLRLGNVYGPGSGFLVGDAAQAFAEQKANALHKYYHQVRRSLVHPGFVDDIAAGFVLAAECSDPPRLLNLAGPAAIPFEELLRTVGRCLGEAWNPPREAWWRELAVRLRTIYQMKWKRRADRVTYLRLGDWQLATERARRVLGFNPATSLEAGIRQTLDWWSTRR